MSVGAKRRKRKRTSPRVPDVAINGKTRMVTLRLDHELHDMVEAMARDLGVDKTAMIRAMLRSGARDTGLVDKLRAERAAMSTVDLFA